MCATLCVHQKFCQTIFYKPLEMTCSLYNYPLTEFTETFPESGIEVYKMEGCSRPGFDVIREIDMCVQIYHTTNVSYTYVMEVCRQEGAELISLETGLKMNTLSSYLLLQFGKAVAVSVGLDNSSGWKWVNGQPLAIGHLNVTNRINNHDGYKDPCDSNYCGIFSVGISKDLKIYDNCCNNIQPYFVCSIPFKH
ncbi:secretory phospholipase A2 receptor-like [Crassostrea angulata]|uniref:secretory phospholipase A2 receptor-like n=1 Tax=Magallana angulata TaxID=2784310 RepID=UPI0022B13A49|nr:secretory phospholipase A2 receptor-like [Crassostrea angulata]